MKTRPPRLPGNSQGEAEAGAKPAAVPASVRGTYRHGDLRRALLDAGIELARIGGPQAVVLREATRRAGVVPNAAYRHFANHAALFGAVRAAALAGVAQAMSHEIGALPPLPAAPSPSEVVAHARGCVRAVGTGYLRFALAETGLFRTAFAANTEADPPTGSVVGAPATAGGPIASDNPFELLRAALDRLMEAGALPPARRPGAEYLAWSAVHGMALLLIDGPLQPVRGDGAQALGERLLDMVERGL